MDALTYLKQMPRSHRKDFAINCGTSLGHLMNCAYGYKPFGASLAIRLEQASHGVLRVEELCPEEPWHVIRKKRKAA